MGQSKDEIARAATLSVGITKIMIKDELILDNAERHIELRWQPLVWPASSRRGMHR